MASRPALLRPSPDRPIFAVVCCCHGSAHTPRFGTEHQPGPHETRWFLSSMHSCCADLGDQLPHRQDMLTGLATDPSLPRLTGAASDAPSGCLPAGPGSEGTAPRTNHVPHNRTAHTEIGTGVAGQTKQHMTSYHVIYGPVARPCGPRRGSPMTTCVVEYTVDPEQIAEFDRFARAWIALVNTHC